MMENTEGVTAIIISIILPLVLGWLQTRRTKSQTGIDISTAWEKLAAPMLKRLEQQETMLTSQAKQIDLLQHSEQELQHKVEVLSLENRSMRAQIDILVNGVWELEKQIEKTGEKPVFTWTKKTPPSE